MLARLVQNFEQCTIAAVAVINIQIALHISKVIEGALGMQALFCDSI